MSPINYVPQFKSYFPCFIFSFFSKIKRLYFCLLTPTLQIHFGRMYEFEMWSEVFWTVWLTNSNATWLPNKKKTSEDYCWRVYWKNSIILNLSNVCLNSVYSMAVLCGILDYFSSRDWGKMFEFLFFLSCLFSFCTWHHIRFNFMNGLERQASLIYCSDWARKALDPSGNLPCWWGVCSTSPARLASALPPWGGLLRLGAPFAFCWWDAALIHAL